MKFSAPSVCSAVIILETAAATFSMFDTAQDKRIGLQITAKKQNQEELYREVEEVEEESRTQHRKHRAFFFPLCLRVLRERFLYF
jgi:high-affinity Fe2+/Pb2+ permease